MEVDVKHRLAGATSRVQDDAESRRLQIQFFGQMFANIQNRTEQPLVGIFHIHEGGEMLFRYDQQMRRCLRIGILDRINLFAIVNFFSRGFSLIDPAEQTIAHAGLLIYIKSSFYN